jgi:hypothetical protein
MKYRSAGHLSEEFGEVLRSSSMDELMRLNPVPDSASI